MTDTDNVVEIGELRLARIKNDYKRTREGCQHRNLEIDTVGETVICCDCKVQVSAYWALNMLRDFWENHAKAFNRKLAAVNEERDTVLHLVAAKRVEQVWRSRRDVPSCPHCQRGIYPEDNLGSARVSRKFEEGLRERERADALSKGLPVVQKLLPRKPPRKTSDIPPKPRSKVKPRPVWQNAPAWAVWLTCDLKGRWTWHLVEPFETGNEYMSGGMHEFAGTTAAPVDGAGIKEKRPKAEQEAPK
jgi:hypothetical protein